MAFLKTVVTIALAILLLILLNNIMDQIFPSKSHSDYSNYHESCVKSSGFNTMNYRSEDPNRAKYDECIKANQQKENDERALKSIYVWGRAVIILLALVVIAIFSFKKYPFFSSGLIAAGLLFAISHPIFSLYGVGSLFGSEADLSESVRTKVAVLKIVISLVGFVGLVFADILFFEKHEQSKVQSLNSNNSVS